MARKPLARIAGTGHAVPETILTNADLERIVDTSDEWITTRTGIKERHVVKRGEKLSDYCLKAARSAMESAGVTAAELDFIIIGTISGDMRFPATSIYVQGALGAVNATAWDISATCSGFLFTLYQGELLIASGRAETGLIIGAEFLTPITNWTDRGTCVLFGDGAGAVILKKAVDERGILATHIGTSGDQAHLLYCFGRGSAGAMNNAQSTAEDVIHMNGNEVFRHAVRTLGRAATETLKRAELTPDQLDWLIPHQANIRIIQATADRLNLPMDQVYVNIDRYGNTSSASVPIAMDEARRRGIIKDGQTALCVAFGGGLTWGGAVIRFLSNIFLYPGQGSQAVGMGRDLAEQYATARERFTQAADVLGFDLAAICFNGSDDELRQTRVTQPALYVHSCVVTELLAERGIHASAAAGHSVGEYAALFCGGVFSFEDGLRLVKTRAEAMQHAGEMNPGTMAAIVGLEDDVVRDVCREASMEGEVVPANFNSPGQLVISGAVNAVRKAVELAKARGAKIAKELSVSGAFHSPLMKPAAEVLQKALAAVPMCAPAIPVISNVTARPHENDDSIRHLLAEQLLSPVRWTESLIDLSGMGDASWLEIGSGNVLSGLLKRTVKGAVGKTISNLSDLTSISAEMSAVS